MLSNFGSITPYSHCALEIDCKLVSAMVVLCAVAVLQLALMNMLAQESHCRTYTYNKTELSHY